MDFITDLPPSETFDAIYVVKCRLTKMAHFLPCMKSIDAPATADLFIREVFRLHGLPKTIISDRGPQFASRFWRRLLACLGVKVNLSSAYHPQTDGSSEVVNQVLEQYLRLFGTYQQDDWRPLLPLAEFAYNNTVNAQTQLTPFYALQGLHPLFDPTVIRSAVVPQAETRAHLIQSALDNLRAQLRLAQERYTAFANRHRLSPPPLSVGDLVFLDRRHLKTLCPSNKLDAKKLGPFKITRQINPVAFELKLPTSMKIHPVFHVSLLEPRLTSPLQIRQQPPPPILVDDEPEYEVESILDSHSLRGGVQYLVH